MPSILPPKAYAIDTHTDSIPVAPQTEPLTQSLQVHCGLASCLAATQGGRRETEMHVTAG